MEATGPLIKAHVTPAVYITKHVPPVHALKSPYRRAFFAYGGFHPTTQKHWAARVCTDLYLVSNHSLPLLQIYDPRPVEAKSDSRPSVSRSAWEYN